MCERLCLRKQCATYLSHEILLLGGVCLSYLEHTLWSYDGCCDYLTVSLAPWHIVYKLKR